MDLILVAPGLLALAPAVLARERTLSRVAGAAEPIVVDDLDQALLGVLDDNVPAAPLAALGAGMDPAGRFVIRADPVTMRVTHDDVRIAARVDDLDARDADALVTMLDAHFAAEGLAFHAPRGDAWFATSPAAQRIATTPLAAAIGSALRPCLPTGADAARWRRWLTEAQMLLHEHPLGARARPVHGLWFSGGGMPRPRVTRDERPDGGRTAIAAAASRDGDVARGLARLAGREALAYADVPAAIAAAGAAARLVVVLPRIVGDDGAATTFAPVAEAMHEAMAALARGTLARLELVADGRGVAATWSMGRPSPWRRIAPRTARFVPPERGA
jgi:hypothetical protein